MEIEKDQKDILEDELIDEVYELEKQNDPSAEIKEIATITTPDYDQIFKSNIFKFAVRKKVKGELVNNIIFVKQYKKTLPDTKTDYLVEKIILPLIKDEKIFADLIKYDDNNMRLFYEALSQKSLGEVLSENNEDSKLSKVVYAFKPVIKFIKEIPKYESRIIDAFTKNELELKDLHKEYFDGKFGYYFGSLKGFLSSKDNKKIESKNETMLDLVSENKTPYKIGSRDGYPRHNLVGKTLDDGRLLDVAGICKCSPEFYLGVMIGCSSVYNKLPNHEGSFRYLTESFLQELNIIQDIERSERAVFASAFFANLRTASRYASFPEYQNFVKENIETALKQADSF